MQTQAETRGIGDNLASADEATLDELKARTEALTDTANLWIEERPEIANEEEAEKAATFLAQLRAQFKKIEDERSRVKAPFLAAAKAVDDRYNPLKRPVEIAANLIKDKLGVWLKRKAAIAARERLEAEAKARREREAADAAARAAEQEGQDKIRAQVAAEEAAKRAEEAEAAAAKAQAPVKVGNLYGGRSTSLRTHTVIEIVDVAKIPARTLKLLCDEPYVREALLRALRNHLEIARVIGEAAVIVRDEQRAV
jgi:hypothetical protein